MVEGMTIKCLGENLSLYRINSNSSCHLWSTYSFPGGSDGKESLDWEDPLEKGMAVHCSILAWRIPWTEEPGGLQSMGLQSVGHN